MDQKRYPSERDDPRQIDLEEVIAARGGKPYTPGPRQAIAFGRDGERLQEGDRLTERNYHSLKGVLDAAYYQAAYGKGKERHADGQPFGDQPIMQIAQAHGVGFLTGQAEKKMREALGMLARGEAEAAQRELLGAIVYTAAAHIHIGRNIDKEGATG